nr:hypothetical protein [Tanacetum cinerariifolium]GEZ98131.1 hypothetical protein [Tanacetum cinerariifolium]
SLRIFFEQRIDAIMVIEEELGMSKNEGFMEMLWDELYRLESSMEDVEGVCGATAYLEQKGEMWPFVGPRNVL